MKSIKSAKLARDCFGGQGGDPFLRHPSKYWFLSIDSPYEFSDSDLILLSEVVPPIVSIEWEPEEPKLKTEKYIPNWQAAQRIAETIHAWSSQNDVKNLAEQIYTELQIAQTRGEVVERSRSKRDQSPTVETKAGEGKEQGSCTCHCGITHVIDPNPTCPVHGTPRKQEEDKPSEWYSHLDVVGMVKELKCRIVELELCVRNKMEQLEVLDSQVLGLNSRLSIVEKNQKDVDHWADKLGEWFKRIAVLLKETERKGE